jgi:hypothetical protein
MLFFSYDAATISRALLSSPPQLDLAVDAAVSIVILSVFFGEIQSFRLMRQAG